MTKIILKMLLGFPALILALFSPLLNPAMNGQQQDSDVIRYGFDRKAASPRFKEYPFKDRNMFFGLSLLPKKREWVVKDLDISWVSLQPHLLWFMIEESPGEYNWQKLDGEVIWLQNLGLDITMVISPAINTFGSQREEIRRLLREGIEKGPYKNPSSVFIHLMRDKKIGAKYKLYPHGKTLPLFIDFIKSAVDRYDGDGKNDMPGLRYAVRNWHFIEEFPMPSWPDVKSYVEVLKLTYSAIKEEDPFARVIIPGLAGNYARLFAFADGFIKDGDAGVWKWRRYKREVIAQNPIVRREKEKYNYILKEGKGYFDIVDIHLYEEKETFMEGKLRWLKARMRKYGYTKPIWVIEGGGPFKKAPGDTSTQGNSYFGTWTAKENAEFVVKLHVMSAGEGVERQHWGLGTKEGGYWQGPWRVMGLLDENDNKKPSYYTFKLMREKLRDFTSVSDLSFGDIRLFRFGFADQQKVYVMWNFTENYVPSNLSHILGKGNVQVTYIFTRIPGFFDAGPKIKVFSTAKIPISITPIFIEKK